MIEALVLIVATVVTYGLWRQGRVRHLRQLVERPHPELAEAVGAGRDEAAIAGATALSFAWEWSRIDPNVLDAIDFAAAKDLDSVIERVHHLGSAIQGRESASLEGVLERLKGYVGEQVAHERLVALGHDVEMAQTSNQEGWDLIVDGEPISIKTVGDLGDIETTDGIRVLAAEDATGEEVVGSTERLDGLSMEESRDLLDGAVEAISEAPDALLESITGVAFVFAGYREIRRVRDGGKSVGAATEDAIVGATLRTAGGGAGGTLGATIGTVVLPGMGTLIGGVAGSFVGAMSTWPVIGYARGRRVRRTSKELRAALADYGESLAPQRDQIVHEVKTPVWRAASARDLLAMRARETRRSLRWLLAPTLGQVATVRAVGHAESATRQMEEDLAPLVTAMTADGVEGHRALGTVAYRMPELDPEPSGHGGHREAVTERFDAVRAARRDQEA